MRNRYYDPSLGSFISEDTYWNTNNMIYGKSWDSEKPKVDVNAIKQSCNLYAYCIGNPIAFIDFVGNDAIWITAKDSAMRFGHTSIIVQDKNLNWNYFYWGKQATYYVSVPDEALEDIDSFNEWLELNGAGTEEGLLKNSTNNYTSSTYIEGNFVQSDKYYRNLVAQYYRKGDTKNYNVFFANCLQQTIQGFARGKLKNGKQVGNVVKGGDIALIPNNFKEIIESIFKNSSFNKTNSEEVA